MVLQVGMQNETECAKRRSKMPSPSEGRMEGRKEGMKERTLRWTSGAAGSQVFFFPYFVRYFFSC